MQRSVWFRLVDTQGAAFNSYPPARVPMSDVHDFATAVSTHYGDGLFGLAAFDLVVYESMEAFHANEPLQVDTLVGPRGGELENALIVRVADPPRKRPRHQDESILDQLQPLPVPLAEYQLDSLAAKQQSGHPIIDTPELHTFWEDMAEEVMLWQVVKKLLPIVTKQRVVIVGSPGVGKSLFLLLVGFYMASVEKKLVLIIRRVDTGDCMNAVVYLDGNGSFAREVNVYSSKMIRLREQLHGAVVLIDGYSQADVKKREHLQPFHLMATLSQYVTKHNESTRVVVLPAWQYNDLEQYARLTDWVIATGLRDTKRLDESTWIKLVKEQYFYSGGSVREFGRTRCNVMDRALQAVANTEIEGYPRWRERRRVLRVAGYAVGANVLVP